MRIKMNQLIYQYNNSEGFQFGPVDLSIDSDKITAIIGANGSGKSTMIKLLLRQLINYSGSYTIDGIEQQSITGDIMHEQNIGYLPEIPLLDEKMTGFELISFVQDIRGIPQEQFEKELALFKSKLGIEEWFSTKRCSEYSMGMKKKTAITLAMLGSMNLVILDEPTNGLDPLAVFGLKQLIDIKHNEGTGIIVTSHMLDFLEKVVHDVLFLRNGNMIQQESLQNIISQWGESKSLDEIYFSMHQEETESAL